MMDHSTQLYFHIGTQSIVVGSLFLFSVSLTIYNNNRNGTIYGKASGRADINKLARKRREQGITQDQLTDHLAYVKPFGVNNA